MIDIDFTLKRIFGKKTFRYVFDYSACRALLNFFQQTPAARSNQHYFGQT